MYLDFATFSDTLLILSNHLSSFIKESKFWSCIL